MRPARTAGGAALALAAVIVVGLVSPRAGGAAQGVSSWSVYHGDPAGRGRATTITSVDLTSPAWVSPVLDGQLYGEPLVLGDRVYMATENDTVDALSAATGALVWSTHVGTPVRSVALPCGDITPTVGITGTPVIDPGRSELFVVATEMVDGSPAHVLVGLATDTGRIELSQGIDPAGSTPAAVLQRTGLTLDSGRVVFGMGGNYGDCSTYRGRVIAVPESGGTPAVFTPDAASDEHEGAVWMGGAAPVVDRSGHVWVTVGNGSVVSPDHAYDDSDAVLELSPSLTVLQYFAPSSWAADNANDLDMSTAPALLADGEVVAAGKARTVFLLDGSSLGSIGGQQASLSEACGDDFAGGVAVDGTTVFLPCRSGPVAVAVSSSPPALRVRWSSDVGGGPPIIAGGLVWTMGPDGVLWGLSPTTGAVRARATVGTPVNHFPTPGIGAGLLLAPGAERVVAFRAPSGTTSARPSHPSSGLGASSARVRAGGRPSNRNPVVLASALLVGLAAVGVAVWIERRHRRAGRVPQQTNTGSTEDHRTVN